MKVGPYEVAREVGRGGFRVVLRARGVAGRDVAVKVLYRRDEKALARFERSSFLYVTVAR